MADGEVPSKSFGNTMQSSSASDESELSSGSRESDNDEDTQLNLLKEFTKNRQKSRVHSDTQGASGNDFITYNVIKNQQKETFIQFDCLKRRLHNKSKVMSNSSRIISFRFRVK